MLRVSTHALPQPGSVKKIDPEAFYTDADLRLLLGISGTALRRARRANELKFARRGGVAWHSGISVIRWLNGEVAHVG